MVLTRQELIVVQDASKGANIGAVIRNVPLLKGIGHFTVGLDTIKIHIQSLSE